MSDETKPCFFCPIKYSTASIEGVQQRLGQAPSAAQHAVGFQSKKRTQNERLSHGWMCESLSFLPFILFLFLLSFLVAGASAPAASRLQLSPQSASISMALCINVPGGLGRCSAMLRPQPSPSQRRPPLQPPALTLHPLCSQQSPAAASTSLCAPLHLFL